MIKKIYAERDSLKQAAGEDTEPSLREPVSGALKTISVVEWTDKGKSGLGYQTCSQKLGLMVYACHPATQEAEVWGLLV